MFQPGTNDRCAATTVNGPRPPSRTAASAARGSSGTGVSPRRPATRRGSPNGAGANRRARQCSTGSRVSSAVPYEGGASSPTSPGP